jgi:serine phosphatase RsbU (regulator of sigma subunit)
VEAADDSARLELGQLDRGLTMADQLRYRLHAVTIRFTRLWAQLRHFTDWLERTAFPAVRRKGGERIQLQVEPDASGRVRGFASSALADGIPAWPAVAGFLHRAGIRALDLDARLEANQIADVLILLHAHRRSLRRAEGKASAGTAAGDMLSETGLHFACTSTRLDDGTLRVAYSYCSMRFSRLVRLFKRRNRRFGDHRALFFAAPKYALLAAAIAITPFVVYLLSRSNWWLLAGISLLAAAALFLLVYLFFMTVGSVEYDNEVKTDHLAKAYDALNRYAEQIQGDLRRARDIQDKMLPDDRNMPLAGRLEWAKHFEPAIEVGGDYFDVAAIDGQKVAILFSDVSGHGMAAAFITAIIKTAFQAWLDDASSAREFILLLNRHLCRLTPDDSFAAVFFALYDAPTGCLTYINGGHNPEPWLLPADSKIPLRTLSDARTMILGVEESLQIKEGCVQLQAGDKLLWLTDGLVEAANPEGEMYGQRRLVDLLGRHRSDHVREMVSRLVADVDRFVAARPKTDDHTVLALQVK